MNREDIIRMAREAGLLGKPTYIHGLEAFADLVAAAEREQCAKVADSWNQNVVWEAKTVSMNIAKEIRVRGEKK